MNPKTRMLLWEECRVGGSIAGLCTAMGLLCLVVARLTTVGRTTLSNTDAIWHSVDFMVLIFTLGVPMAVAVLLVLNTANSGHLTGGFSRRVLTLPVDTSRAVLVALCTRFVVVSLVSALMISVCWGLFQHGPGMRTIFVLAGLYLVVQLLDWTRAVAALVVPVLVLSAILAALEYVGGLGVWIGALVEEASVSPGFLLAFLLLAAAGGGVAWLLVGQARCGERLALFDLPSRESLMVLPMMERRRDFVSPMTAQVWFELRRGGLLFPLMVFCSWLLTAGLGMAIFPRSPRAGEIYNSFLAWTGAHLNNAVIFEWAPLIALVIGALAWGIWDFRRPVFGGGRPRTFMLRPCLSKAQLVEARLLAIAFSLAGVLLVVTLVRAFSMLSSDHYLIAGILRWGLAQGAVGFREALLLLVGPSLVTGGLAWLLMAGLSIGRSGWFWLTFSATGVLLWLFGAEYLSGPDWLIFTLILLWALALTLISEWLRHLIAFYGKGLLDKKHFLSCLALWAGITAVFFPWNAWKDSEQTPLLLIGTLAFGAGVLLPFAERLYRLGYRGRGEGLATESPAQHRRGMAGNRQGIFFWGIGVALTAAALLWLRWPSEPAWKEVQRAKGLPTNLTELNAWYKEVPIERNLAAQYLPLARELGRRDMMFDAMAAKEAPVRCPDAVKGWNGPQNCLFVVGDAEMPRTGPVSEDALAYSRRYYEMVGAELAEQLHAVAALGLTESRYPMDLRMGAATPLPHLARMRHLARILRLESLLATVDNRPEEAIAALEAQIPLADSLKEEPILISQLVRAAMLDMIYGGEESLLNRMEISDVDLARLQGVLRQSIPTDPAESSMRRAIIGENIILRSAIDEKYGLGSLAIAVTEYEKPHNDSSELLCRTLAPVGAFSGRTCMDNLIFSEWGRRFEARHEAMVTGNPVAEDIVDDDDRWMIGLMAHALWYPLWLPGYRSSDIEIRLHTQADIACTAIAVERYRRAQGRLPERLALLVPAYLDAVPKDYWNRRKPLSYRIKENGEFVVYSFARNEKDDQGEEVQNGAFYNGDLTFTVAPPEARRAGRMPAST